MTETRYRARCVGDITLRNYNFFSFSLLLPFIYFCYFFFYFQQMNFYYQLAHGETASIVGGFKLKQKRENLNCVLEICFEWCRKSERERREDLFVCANSEENVKCFHMRRFKSEKERNYRFSCRLSSVIYLLFSEHKWTFKDFIRNYKSKIIDLQFNLSVGFRWQVDKTFVDIWVTWTLKASDRSEL